MSVARNIEILSVTAARCDDLEQVMRGCGYGRNAGAAAAAAGDHATDGGL